MTRSVNSSEYGQTLPINQKKLEEIQQETEPDQSKVPYTQRMAKRQERCANTRSPLTTATETSLRPKIDWSSEQAG